MTYDPEKHHRRSIRLKGYDYANPGWYYLTVCTYDRKFLFGEIVRDRMHLSEIGALAQQCWNEIPQHFRRASLDVCVLMPNHLHGIVVIGGELPSGTGARRGTPWRAPTVRAAAFGKPVPGSLATMVGLLKQAVTRRVGARLPASVGARLPASVGARLPASVGARLPASAGARLPASVGARHGVPVHIWHENYYEHIIRNEKELNRIREYIRTNPLRWRYDVENPASDREAVDDIEDILSADDDP